MMEQQQHIDALFKKAQLTPTTIPFEESKRLFIQHVEAVATTTNRKRSFMNLKNILIMIGIIGILSILITFSFSTQKTNEVLLQKQVKPQEILVENKSLEKSESASIETLQTSATKKSEIWTNLLQPLPLNEIFLKQKRELQRGTFQLFSTLPLSEKMDDRSSFPKLTEEEIAANHKQKKKMIKALSKFDSKVYAYIPSGSYSYNGVPVSVQAFYIQREEVTNLEYRTFLFDLLIQDRKQEFLLAAPDQTLWTKALADSLIQYQNDYFSDYKFDDFPIVNVSKKGVELYCNWITEETNKMRKDDPINDARIPDLLEWTMAASNMGKLTIYPWEGDQLTTDGTFNANFKLDEFEGNLKAIDQKTKTNYNHRTTFEYVVGLMIAWSKSYEPNELGLYNMSGNVAEMVLMRASTDKLGIEKPTENQLATCGGSWMSAPDELKIFHPTITDYINGHPTIGFRVVVTHLSQRALAR